MPAVLVPAGMPAGPTADDAISQVSFQSQCQDTNNHPEDSHRYGGNTQHAISQVGQRQCGASINHADCSRRCSANADDEISQVASQPFRVGDNAEARAIIQRAHADIVALLEFRRAQVSQQMERGTADTRRWATAQEAELAQLYGLCARTLKQAKEELEEGDRIHKAAADEWTAKPAEFEQRAAQLARAHAEEWKQFAEVAQQELARQ